MRQFWVCFFSVCALPFAPRVADGAEIAQWDFNADLESSTGQAALLENYAGPAIFPDYLFDVADIGGANAEVAHFARGTFFRVMPGMGPNGGGVYVNQYTIVMDVMFPDRSPSGGSAALLQTNEANQNDGDWFVDPSGKLGINGVFGDAGKPIEDGVWHRLALVLDLSTGAGTYTSFIDGVQVQQLTGEARDGRFALYSVNDGFNDGFSIFADDNAENAEGSINSLQFRNVALAPADIAALGGPSADGIPIPADPRDCSFRAFQTKYDRATNSVSGTWLPIAGENGFKVFQGARQVGGTLAPAATSFVDPTPTAGGAGVVYTLQPLKANGTAERQCDAAPIDTFGCIAGLTCCVDQAAKSVTLAWLPAANVTLSGIRVARNGTQIGTPGGAEASFTDGSVANPGSYLYEVVALLGGDPLCSLTCKATVTGVPIGSDGPCGGVLNTYQFDDDLKSSTGGKDLIPQISPPIDPVGGVPEFSFEDADIGGKTAKVLRYSRGTFFRLYTGLGPNGGGGYTNRYTLIMDLLFEGGKIDESGYASLYQTNEANGNDGDWFVRGTDRGVGIDGNYGGFVVDDEWHRVALVVDLPARTFTSYVDGVRVQENAREDVDGRFSLYTTNDGDFEGISIFADNSGDSSAGLVNSVQSRDVALTPGEVAAFGGPSASGIPPAPPCPHTLACKVDQATKTATLTWNKGSGLPGDGFTIRRNGAVLATVSLATATYIDGGLAPGAYLYEISLNDPSSGCSNLPLAAQAEIAGENLFVEDFEAYADDAAFGAAGWESRNERDAVENSAWTVENPARRANPPTFNGRPSLGRFAISDSTFGGGDAVQNAPGSGMSHDLVSPSFGAQGADSVWLHFDAAAQLNNDGDAAFRIDVSTDGGNGWTTVLERVSPGRLIDPLPMFDANADGLYGRVHLDISAQAANKPSVRLRFRHFEPTWDWWVAIDNVRVDQVPGNGGPNVVLPQETFTAGIPAAWKVVSGPESDGADPWSTVDSCSLSLESTGGTFPDAADGRQLHHFDGQSVLADPFCSSAKADEFLITPTLDLSGQGRVFLGLGSAILPSRKAAAEILVSLDGGQTFLPEPVFSYGGGALSVEDEEPYFNRFVLEVPPAAGQARVAFAFHYKSLEGTIPGGTWWAIDDVTVTSTEAVSEVNWIRGEFSGDGGLDISDAVASLSFQFTAGAAPTCPAAMDFNKDGGIDVSDPISLLGYLFLGGAPPPAPFPACEQLTGCPQDACG